jgi:hypothetical protein
MENFGTIAYLFFYDSVGIRSHVFIHNNILKTYKISNNIKKEKEIKLVLNEGICIQIKHKFKPKLQGKPMGSAMYCYSQPHRVIYYSHVLSCT